MKNFIGEEKTNMLSNAIAKIVFDYSKNDNIDSIFVNTSVLEGKIPTISLNMTCTGLVTRSDYLNVASQVKDLQEKTNIKILFDIQDTHNYGLFDLYIMLCGGISSCGRLIDGEILFDRTGKFSELQAISRRLKKENITHSPKLSVNVSKTLIHTDKESRAKLVS